MLCATAGPAFFGLYLLATHKKPHLGLRSAQTGCTARPIAYAECIEEPTAVKAPASRRTSHTSSALLEPASYHGSADRRALAHCIAHQATPLEQKIPVPAGNPRAWDTALARRHCKSKTFTTGDLSRQFPKSDSVFETKDFFFLFMNAIDIRMWNAALRSWVW